MSGSLWSYGLHSPWNSPGENTGMGSCFLLQRIFPTQELNPGLSYCRQSLPAEPPRNDSKCFKVVACFGDRGWADPFSDLGILLFLYLNLYCSFLHSFYPQASKKGLSCPSYHLFSRNYILPRLLEFSLHSLSHFLLLFQEHVLWSV